MVIPGQPIELLEARVRAQTGGDLMNELDLYERPPAEAADVLHRYLGCARVQSGEALEAARKEYRSRNRRSQARAAIPEAWRELVEK